MIDIQHNNIVKFSGVFLAFCEETSEGVANVAKSSGKIYCVGGVEHEGRCSRLNKNFFLVPNGIYQMDISAEAKQIYTFLCYCENRKTYQCHPSYKTIGRNVDMSVNTVRKYITELIEKKLIATKNTHRFTSEGMKQNSVLRYTLLPIQNAVDCYHQ